MVDAVDAGRSPTTGPRPVPPLPVDPSRPAPRPAPPGAGHEGDLAQEEILVAASALREAADHLLGVRAQVGGVAEAAGAVQAVLGGVAAALPLAVITTDRHGVVSEANAAAGHLLGAPPSRLCGKPLQVFVPPEQRRAVRSTVARAWTAGLSRCRVPLVPRSGRPTEVDAVVAATGEAAGGRGGLQWVLAPAGAAGAPVLDASDDAVRALAELCALRPGSEELQPLMGRVAALVVRALPAADHASITLGDPCAPAVTATGSQAAQRLDGLQVLGGAGPAVDAWARGTVVTSADLGSERRWPGFTRAARSAGPVAVAAVPVRSGPDVVGVLTLYGSPRRGGPSPGASGVVSGAVVERAAVLATAIAALVDHDRHVDELRATAEQLRTALASRAVIEQAKGMAAVWLGCGVDEAFAALSRWSQDRNVKLREVAAFVVGVPDAARPLLVSRAAA